jgi:hypothetical protein
MKFGTGDDAPEKTESPSGQRGKRHTAQQATNRAMPAGNDLKRVKGTETNRVAITYNDKGDIVRVCSDAPVEIYEVSPHTPHDRVYIRTRFEIGSKFVDEEIGGYPIGHYRDDHLGRLPPGMPSGRAFAIARAMSKP